MKKSDEKMKIKNKRFISLILSVSLPLSFASCTVLDKTLKTTKEDTSVCNYDDETTNFETTTKEETPFYVDDENICVTTNVNLRDDYNLNSEVITVIDEYDKLKRIKTNDEWDYVYYEGNYGYVSSKYVEELGDNFVEVDISDQNLYLYVDDELILTADVVTGKKDKYDTRIGCHSIYSKEKDRYLKGDGYKVYVNYWLPFDKGQGLHDASWRTSFNKDDYLNGSHGCVNMKKEDVKIVYDNVSVGTKVLVHK